MRNDHTDITVVLDRSGSMASVVEPTIAGFNKFLRDQACAPGTASLTLHQFDDVYETPIPTQDIGLAPLLTTLTFVPRGSTALLDAIGRSIDDTGHRLECLPAAARPAKVVFVIITDGQENASKEYTHARVMEKIKHQRERYAWEIIFMGANQDAVRVGKSLNVSIGNSITYASNQYGTQAVFDSTSNNIRSFRGGQSVNCAYTEADRKKQKKAGAVAST